jgi:hypothetical protein
MTRIEEIEDLRYLLDESKHWKNLYLQSNNQVLAYVKKEDLWIEIRRSLNRRIEKLEAVREEAKDFMVKLMTGRAKADKLQKALR